MDNSPQCSSPALFYSCFHTITIHAGIATANVYIYKCFEFVHLPNTSWAKGSANKKSNLNDRLPFMS